MTKQDITSTDYILITLLAAACVVMLPCAGLLLALGCVLGTPALLFLTLRQILIEIVAALFGRAHKQIPLQQIPPTGGQKGAQPNG